MNGALQADGSHAAAARVSAHRGAAATYRPGAEGRRAPVERARADDPRRQRRDSRPRIPGTEARCRPAAGAGHHELGSAWRAHREVGARGADVARQAQSHGAERSRRRAHPRIAPGRDRLVGQAALLAPRDRAGDDPGRHRRRDPRSQPAGRAGRAVGYPAVSRRARGAPRELPVPTATSVVAPSRSTGARSRPSG